MKKGNVSKKNSASGSALGFEAALWLARTNLAIRRDRRQPCPGTSDSFHRDLHKDLKADCILANPPLNTSDSDVVRMRENARWKFDAPLSTAESSYN